MSSPLPDNALEKPSLDNKRRLANRALDQLEVAAGGREKLLDALVHAPETPEQQRLVGLLADPRMDPCNLGKVCAAADLSVGEFLKMLREGKHARALMAAMDRVEELLPDVAEDLMARAVPHLAPCTDCLNSGVLVDLQDDPEHEGRKIEVETKCLTCRGSGKVPVQPDLARQKIALEVGGLLKREPAVVVNQNTGFFGRGFGGDERRDLRGRMDEILQPPRPQGEQAVDAEVVGAPAAEEEGE